MDWVAELKGQTVGLDTAPLIFYIEEHPTYCPIVEPFFDAVARGELRVVTSTITLIEVLIHPLRKQDETLAHRYNDILLSSPGIHVASVTPTTAKMAAELRSRFNLKTPDAIQLATVVRHGATALLTNDRDFGSAPLKVLRLLDLARN